MPIKKRANIAIVEILSDNGNVISVLPETISGIERSYRSNGIRFYFHDGKVQEFSNCDREEYEHYVNAWMDALSYNRGTYAPEDEVGMLPMAPPELYKEETI